jgi:PAS domain S-box-containing protein
MPDNLKNVDRDDLIAEVRRLRQRETIFDTTQEIANLGYCEWDYDTDTIISCTASYAQIFGMSTEEVIASQASRAKFMALVHPNDRDHCIESYRRQLKTESAGVEYRIFRKDGAVRLVKEVAISSQDSEQSASQTMVLIQDITEHGKMRLEIRESAAKLKLAAETAKLGYWHFDEMSNTYIDISEEYAGIFGYSVDEFLALYRTLDNDMELVHPEDKDALLEAYDWADGRVDFDYRIQHRDGHWIHVREISTDILDAAGNYIEAIGTLQDISELKEAQLVAERANHAKTDFLSRMSHELRTPLNAILGFSQLLEYDQGLDKQQQSKATNIFNAGQHLLTLINEILDLSRLEAGVTDVVIEPVSLTSVIDDSIALVDDMAKKRGVAIVCTMDNCRGLMVEADTTRLKQVFLNLLSNAVKYNRENGKIRVTSDQDEHGLISVSIADTGCGISPDRLGELFKPFNRLGAEFGEVEGTGIGLVITKQLIELMQGELKVDTRLGEGSIFTIRLKMVRDDAAISNIPEIAPEFSGHDVTHRAITELPILVVEDNSVHRELLAAQLDALGYLADYATSGLEALSLWKSGNYSLLLTDIRMPEMDGHQLISQIRSEQSSQTRAPIIATTASTMENDVQQCLDSGADDVITKPVAMEDLKQALDKWLSAQISKVV